MKLDEKLKKKKIIVSIHVLWLKWLISYEKKLKIKFI